MTQDIHQQNYYNQFDNRLSSILDPQSLKFLDELLIESRKEIFQKGEKSEKKES